MKFVCHKENFSNFVLYFVELTLKNWEESNMVEWKKLGEVCTLERGVRVVRKNLLENGDIPVFQNSLTPLGYFGKSNYPAHTPFVICAGAAAEIGYSNVPFWAADDCTCVICNSSVISKYAYYYLLVNQHVLKSQVRRASVPRLSKNVIEKMRIPVPSLSEQERIVGILDTFTASIDNLKEQITLRRKQYEFYRDKLLDLEGKEGVEMKTLGEIGRMIRGNGLQKSDFRETGFPCIHYGQIHTYYGTSASTTKSFCDVEFAKKLKKAHSGDLLIATTSEDVDACCKAVAWLGDEDVAYSGDSYCFSHNQNPKYMSYLFQTELFAKQKRKVANGAKVVRVSGESMEKFIFPFPSLSEQERIVGILDTFEACITNLEAQVVLRQKQYEYYRNKLLTFD